MISRSGSWKNGARSWRRLWQSIRKGVGCNKINYWASPSMSIESSPPSTKYLLVTARSERVLRAHLPDNTPQLVLYNSPIPSSVQDLSYYWHLEKATETPPSLASPAAAASFYRIRSACTGSYWTSLEWRVITTTVENNNTMHPHPPAWHPCRPPVFSLPLIVPSRRRPTPTSMAHLPAQWLALPSPPRGIKRDGVGRPGESRGAHRVTCGVPGGPPEPESEVPCGARKGLRPAPGDHHHAYV